MSLSAVGQPLLDPQFFQSNPRHHEAKKLIFSEQAQSLHHYTYLREWLTSGAPLRSEAYRVAMGTAAEEGHLHVMKLLLEEGGVGSQEALDHALVLACQGAQMEVLEFLRLENRMINSEIIGVALVSTALVVSEKQKFSDVLDFLLSLEIAFPKQDLEAAIIFTASAFHEETLDIILKKILIPSQNIDVAVEILIQVRGHIPKAVFYETATLIVDRVDSEREDELNERLLYSARCLEIPMEYRCHMPLPKLPPESGLGTLLRRIDHLDLDHEFVEAKNIVVGVEHSAIEALLSACKLPILSEEAYTALPLRQQQLICGRFRTYGFTVESEVEHTYDLYRTFCSRARRSHERLEWLLKKKFASRRVADLGDFGIPDPQRRSEAFKQWYKQIYQQLTYLEIFRLGLPKDDQEALAFEILSTTQACAGYMQAAIGELFMRHIQGVTVGTPVEQLFISHLSKAHRQAVDQVKSKMGEDVHMINDIEGILAPFGFLKMESDGQGSQLNHGDVIALFHQSYDFKGLIHAIIESLQQQPQIKYQFVSLFNTGVDEATIHQIECETAADEALASLFEAAEKEFAKRFVEHGSSRLTQAELKVVPLKFSDGNLRKSYHAFWGASASASSPTYAEFAHQARATALPVILKELSATHHFAQQVFKEVCDRKIDEMEIYRSPLQPDGTAKPEAVIGWLLDQKFFR